MEINLPSKVRKSIYVISTVVSPVMAYLANEGTISAFVFGLYAVFMTAVTALAAVNTTTK